MIPIYGTAMVGQTYVIVAALKSRGISALVGFTTGEFGENVVLVYPRDVDRANGIIDELGKSGELFSYC